MFLYGLIPHMAWTSFSQPEAEPILSTKTPRPCSKFPQTRHDDVCFFGETLRCASRGIAESGDARLAVGLPQHDDFSVMSHGKIQLLIFLPRRHAESSPRYVRRCPYPMTSLGRQTWKVFWELHSGTVDHTGTIMPMFDTGCLGLIGKPEAADYWRRCRVAQGPFLQHAHACNNLQPAWKWRFDYFCTRYACLLNNHMYANYYSLWWNDLR